MAAWNFLEEMFEGGWFTTYGDRYGRVFPFENILFDGQRIHAAVELMGGKEYRERWVFERLVRMS